MLIYKIHWEVYENFGTNLFSCHTGEQSKLLLILIIGTPPKKYLEFPPGFFIIYSISKFCVVSPSYLSLLPFYIQVILTDHPIELFLLTLYVSTKQESGPDS